MYSSELILVSVSKITDTLTNNCSVWTPLQCVPCRFILRVSRGNRAPIVRRLVGSVWFWRNYAVFHGLPLKQSITFTLEFRCINQGPKPPPRAVGLWDASRVPSACAANP